MKVTGRNVIGLCYNLRQIFGRSLSVARATAVEYESLNSALLIKPADL